MEVNGHLCPTHLHYQSTYVVVESDQHVTGLGGNGSGTRDDGQLDMVRLRLA